MSYLDHIHYCNQYQIDHFTSFYIAGQPVGWLKAEFIDALRQWPEYFQRRSNGIHLTSNAETFAQRSELLDEVVQQLHQQGVIDKIHGERYAVTPSGRAQALCTLDRSSAPYFGIRAFGQHLNGYVRDGDEIRLWLGRRALDRWNEPGKLDNMVAGGLPLDIGLEENLLKECAEEANVPAELARQAKPVGAVTYCRETRSGLKPDVLYCYDLELPADFVPVNTDGETEEFRLYSLDEVAEIVQNSSDIKRNCNLVITDFLLRFGYIDSSHPDYLEIVTSLHQPLPQVSR